MKTSRRNIGVALFVALGLVFIGSHSASALYSVDELNTKLENGFNTAKQLDYGDSTTNNDSCRQVTNIAKNNNESIETLRYTYINQGYSGHSAASYKSPSWLSKSGFPNTTNPVVVQYGATELDLQINSMVMLCGTLVRPDVGTACKNMPTATMLDDNRWVTDGNPDSYPNPIGNVCLRPAMTANYTRIENLTAATTGPLQGRVVIAPGKTLTIVRDENSRYWFAAPVVFKYVFNRPITAGGKITLTLRTKKINNYNGTYKCNTGFVNGPNDFKSTCKPYEDEVSLRIQVSASYNLNPQINVSSTGAVMSGQTYDVRGEITNNGGTASTGTNWQVSRMVYAPGVAPPTAPPSDGALNPCAAFTGYKAGSCQSYSSGTNNFSVGGPFSVGSRTDTADVEMGAKICYAASVNTPTPLAAPAWRHSALKCVIIGKKPKINILGGDVRTGSDIDVSNTSISIDNRVRWYGSWGEYGVFANGDNIEARFGSAASLKDGPTALGRKGTNPLTFANTPANLPASTNMIPGQFGDSGLGTSTLASALQTLLPPETAGFNADLASISSDGRYDVGSEGVRGDNITRSLVINSSRTVTITGNITYAANVTVPNNLPQVVIIAKEIVIAEGVERVDAWLLTPADDGTLKTCSINSATNLRTTNCNKQLQVNGPVVAKTGRLYRTAGSDSVNPGEAGKPAEVMNLPASTYVWQYTQAARQGGLRTVQLTELPPRY